MATDAPEVGPELKPDRPPPAYADHPAKRNPAADAVCWCCGGRTLDRHCKLVCTNCGFMRDCSDP